MLHISWGGSIAALDYEEVVITDDMLIVLAMAGAGITQLGIALGAASIAESVIENNPVTKTANSLIEVGKKITGRLGL